MVLVDGGQKSSERRLSELEQTQKVYICSNNKASFAETVFPAVDRSLPDIVPRLMARFSSKEGYKLFDDTIPVRTCICLRFCI